MYTTIDEFKRWGIVAGYTSAGGGYWRYFPSEDIANYESLGEAFKITPDQMVRVHQTHSAKVFCADRSHGGMGVCRNGDGQDYDGLITDERGLMLTIVTADCVPLFLFDPIKRVIALVHSGRIGTFLEIAAEAVRKMQEVYGTDPLDLCCVLGPHMCTEHHVIQKKDVEALSREGSATEPIPWISMEKSGNCHVDMGAGIVASLESTGVKKENIVDQHICTYERADLYSWRRDHLREKRNLSFMMIP